MPPQSESAVNALEIEKIRKVVKSAFDTEYTFWGWLKKKPVEVISNRDMKAPIRLKPGGKFRHYNPDGGNYGRGSGPFFDKAVMSVQHLLEAVEWTDLSDMATDDERKAVLNTFKDNLANAMDEMQRNLEALLMGDGTGVLGTITTYTVGGGTGGGDRLVFNTDGFRAKLLRDDMDLNVYAANLLTNRTPGAERTVVFYDGPNNTVDISPSLATGIATDKVVVSGLTATPPVSVLGVQYHQSNASTGTWLGFSRSATPQIRANRVAAGGVLALPHARLAVNKITDRLGKGKLKRLTAWTHPAQAAAYEELAQLSTMLMKMPSGGKIDMYYGEDMQLAGVPLKLSNMWDRTRIDFIGDNFYRAEMRGLDFIKKNGHYIFDGRGSDGGLAAYNLIYPAISFNLGNDNPAEGAYIDTLSVPTGY